MSNVLSHILDSYPDDNFLIADGFDDAVIGLDEQCKKMCLSLYVVGVPELGRIFAGFSETAAVPFFDSIEAARAGA